VTESQWIRCLDSVTHQLTQLQPGERKTIGFVSLLLLCNASPTRMRSAVTVVDPRRDQPAPSFTKLEPEPFIVADDTAGWFSQRSTFAGGEVLVALFSTGSLSVGHEKVPGGGQLRSPVVAS